MALLIYIFASSIPPVSIVVVPKWFPSNIRRRRHMLGLWEQMHIEQQNCTNSSIGIGEWIGPGFTRMH